MITEEIIEEEVDKPKRRISKTTMVTPQNVKAFEKQSLLKEKRKNELEEDLEKTIL